jgi:hypothetical protein
MTRQARTLPRDNLQGNETTKQPSVQSSAQLGGVSSDLRALGELRGENLFS